MPAHRERTIMHVRPPPDLHPRRARGLGPPAAMLALAAVLTAGGCRTFTPPAQTKTIHSGPKGQVKMVSFEATRRATYVMVDEHGVVRMAAEPPPDAALDASVDATATLKAMLEKVELEGTLEAEVVEKIVKLTERTQAVVLMRDAMFRLAEMHVNGVISDGDYLTLYNKALAGAIALAAPDAETAQAMLRALLLEALVEKLPEDERARFMLNPESSVRDITNLLYPDRPRTPGDQQEGRG